MARRILVTGASGLVGRAVYRELKNNTNWSVLGLAYSRAQGELRKCDLTNSEELQAVFKDFMPTFVVHAAGESRRKVVEDDRKATKRLNVDATRQICQEAKKLGVPVLFISTDNVFDGYRPPYKYNDSPCPVNFYGLSKLDGENVTMEVSKGNLILRLPLLYGEVERLEDNPVTSLLELVLDTSKRHSVCDYRRLYPTLNDDVAYVIHQLIDLKYKDSAICGVFHWSGDENMTKFDMALCIGGTFRLPTGHISANIKQPHGPPMPDDPQLDTTRVKQLGIKKHTPFATGIRDVLKSFVPMH